MNAGNDNQPAWTDAERDSISIPLLALMEQLDAVNPLWTKFSVVRDASGDLLIALCDTAD